MPSARGLDGSGSRQTPVASLEHAALTALAEAARIDDRDRLLRHFAQCWRAMTRANLVTVAVESAPAPCYRTVVVDEAGLVTHSDLQLADQSDLVEELSRHALSRVTGASGELITRVLESSADALPVGAVLLAGAAPLPEELDCLFRRAAADLLARAAARDRLLRDAKLEAMAEFAAGAGHEINNPLAAISGRAQLLLRDEQHPERRRHLTTIGAQALRIRDMIGDTMLFARPPMPQPQSLNLADVLNTVIGKLAEDCTPRRLTMERAYADDVPIWADETQLSVVVSELIRNAGEASPEEGRIHVAASRTSANEQKWVLLTVRDEGDGLPAEAAEHLFDPFYSGRPAGRGLGFGLSKCWRIVTNHGGRIEVDGDLKHGFGIVVQWPAGNRSVR